MLIKIKKNGNLIFKKLKFKCSFGRFGLKKNKKEGDLHTPKGIFSLGKIYYRADRIEKIDTFLQHRIIRKHMGWCNDPSDLSYNKEFDLRSGKKGEKLFRKDHRYDIFIVINYNINPIIPNRGSAIFLHLTKDYKPTAGCVSISLKNFLILLKFIKKKTKIIIG